MDKNVVGLVRVLSASVACAYLICRHAAGSRRSVCRQRRFWVRGGFTQPRCSDTVREYRAGPDTGLRVGKEIVRLPFQHYGGYSYSDSDIVAFSHTHMVGAGVGDLGNFGVMPVRASMSTLGSDSALKSLLTTPAGHSMPLDHAQEKARPGEYSIHFSDQNISPRF